MDIKNKEFWECVDKLEELAGKASPGPWTTDKSEVYLAYTPNHERTFGYGCDNTFICDLNDGEYHEYKSSGEQVANAEYIAAANPAMIKEMIAKLRELQIHEAENERFAALCRDAHAVITSEEKEVTDKINHPPHYTKHKTEVIEITRYLPFCLGNVVKYVLRPPEPPS